jgi:hypothetical protein
MRKFLVAAAVATTALTAAAPAAAQYYPAPARQPYYGQGYNYGQNKWQLIRTYDARVARVQRAIERNDSRDRISEREARSLRAEARWLRDRVRRLSSSGINHRERRELDVRIGRLEQRLRVDIRDDNGRPGRGYDGYGRGRDGDGWRDRDRDGRNDRYEDDRGRYPG